MPLGITAATVQFLIVSECPCVAKFEQKTFFAQKVCISEKNLHESIQLTPGIPQNFFYRFLTSSMIDLKIILGKGEIFLLQRFVVPRSCDFCWRGLQFCTTAEIKLRKKTTFGSRGFITFGNRRENAQASKAKNTLLVLFFSQHFSIHLSPKDLESPPENLQTNISTLTMTHTIFFKTSVKWDFSYFYPYFFNHFFFDKIFLMFFVFLLVSLKIWFQKALYK